MTEVIQGILNESKEYYRIMKRESVGQLLINRRGHIKRQVVGKNTYIILRKYIYGKPRCIYFGRDTSLFSMEIMQEYANRKKAIVNLRASKQAMKALHISNAEIVNKNFLPVLKNVFVDFCKMGLWEFGLELVGDWCLRVYQNYCNVDSFSNNNMFVNIAMEKMHSNRLTNIGKMLRFLGFWEEFDFSDESVAYKGGNFQVKILKTERENGRAWIESYQEGRDLGVIPLAQDCMNLLLRNSTEIKARDVGTVVVPSMPAFMLHKLIVIGKRSKEENREKDCRQLNAVAKAIVASSDLMEETGRIFAGLHKAWQKNILKSAKQLKHNYPVGCETVMDLLDQMP